MKIQFVSRHALFFVSYLMTSENRLENGPFFKSIKEGVGEYNPTSLIEIDISPEMFIKTIGFVTNERHGFANNILMEAMKGIGAPKDYVDLEHQLGIAANNPDHPDHDEAVVIATRLGEIRANFSASVEADAVQKTLNWINSLTF